MNKTDYASQKLVVNVPDCLLNDVYWFEQESLSCCIHAFFILEEYNFRLNVKCFITVEENLEIREIYT